MRLKDAAKFDFTKLIAPKANASKAKVDGLQVIALEQLELALKQF